MTTDLVSKFEKHGIHVVYVDARDVARKIDDGDNYDRIIKKVETAQSSNCATTYLTSLGLLQYITYKKPCVAKLCSVLTEYCNDTLPHLLLRVVSEYTMNENQQISTSCINAPNVKILTDDEIEREIDVYYDSMFINDASLYKYIFHQIIYRTSVQRPIVNK